jgi:[acyl-carrier-protein] S-malonyltransferase
MSRPFALLFPGQGAQEVGMGRALITSDEFTKALFERASFIAKTDLAALCLKGPDRTLAETRFLQPALTCVCLGLLRRFQSTGIVARAAAGHSVGELAALAASGIATPEDMADAAAMRGRLMGDAASTRPGAMAAVSGGTPEEIQAAIDAFDNPPGGVLVIAAVNAPSQVTISGDSDLVAAFLRLGISPNRRVTPLRVSGAWHSPHMAPAVDAFETYFSALALSSAAYPLICNRDGRLISTPKEAKAAVPGQLVRPVRWDLVMRSLSDLGIADFVEIGPGKVLRGLVRLNDKNPEVSVHSVSDVGSLERTARALSQ